jgi:hypothetical protein
MARLQAPQGPNATPSYEPPKPKRAPKRTHGSRKGSLRPPSGRGGPQGKGGGKGGPAPGAIDDTQLNWINQNHRKYWDTLVSPQFGGVGINPSGMGNNPYWNSYIDQQFQNAETGFQNAAFGNNDLHFATYMTGLGAGGGAGQLAPLGTGQAGMVDTGNPFTSSSGLGAPPAPVTPLGPKPNRNRHPGQLKAWKKQKKHLGGKPETLNQINVNPAASGLGYTDQLRRGFLSLSPMERGDVALGKTATPGRWSPWG